MLVNAVDSADAEAGVREFKPPAFQIIILVRKYRYWDVYAVPSYRCLGTFPAISL